MPTRTHHFVPFLTLTCLCSLALACGGGGARTATDAGLGDASPASDADVSLDAGVIDSGPAPMTGNPLPDGADDCVGDAITLDPVGTVDRWSFGNAGTGLMHTGRDCIGCHSTMRGPRLRLAGSVMDAWHEPDDCFGPEGITVEVIGADGVSTFMHTNATGNFYTNATIALPYTVKLTGPDGATREMFTPQTDTDCAHCHTQAGTNGAPGRIGRP